MDAEFEEEYCDECGRALPYYQIRDDDVDADCPHCRDEYPICGSTDTETGKPCQRTVEYEWLNCWEH